MKSWHKNQKITPQQETPQEKTSPSSNENTDAVTEAELIKQIGQVLTQQLYIEQFVQLLEMVSLPNLGTPKTAEASSYALWAMVSHTMTTCDHLRTSISISKDSDWIIANKAEADNLVYGIIAYLEEVCLQIFGVLIVP